MTQEEYDTFYGFTPNMTPQERQARSREITRTIKLSGGEVDEDEPDWEGMKGEYADNAYQDYKNEAIRELNSR